MLRRIITVVLALCLTAGLLPLAAEAEDVTGLSCTVDGVTYTYSVITGDGDGLYAEITGVECEDNITSLSIPAALPYNGETVTVRAYCPQNSEPYCDTLSSVTFPEGLDVIGDRAFENCRFTELVIPPHIKSIGKWAFSGCRELESLTILPGVRTIGVSAFSFCDGLIGKTVELPATVDTLCNGAFWGIMALDETETDKRPLTVRILNPDIVFEESERYTSSYYAAGDTEHSRILEASDPFGASAYVVLCGYEKTSLGTDSALKKYVEKFNGTIIFRSWGKQGGGGFIEHYYTREISFRALEYIPQTHRVSGFLPDGVEVRLMRGGEPVELTVENGAFSAEIEEGADVVITAHKEGFYDQILVKTAAEFKNDWIVNLDAFTPLPAAGRLTVDAIRGTAALTSFDGLTFALSAGEEALTEGVDYEISYPYIVLTDPEAFRADTELKLSVFPDASLRLGNAEAVTTGAEGRFSVILTEWGRINVAAEGGTEAPNIVVIFDSEGNAVSSGETEAGMFCSDRLPAGSYSAAAFNKNGAFNGVSSLAAFLKLGLRSGRDYALSSSPISVEDGKTAEVSLSVPNFDASGMIAFVRPELSGVIIRKTGVVSGEWFDVQVRYSLAEGVSPEGAKINLTLPESAVLRAVSTATEEMTVNDGAVNIENDSGTLYLTVKSAVTGVQSFGASVTAAGVTVPIGTASVQVVGTLKVDTDDAFPHDRSGFVTVMTVPDTEVRLYVDNGEEPISTGISNGNGRLTLSYALPDSAVYGQSVALRAEAELDGVKTSDTVTVTYFPSGTFLKKLDLIYCDHRYSVLNIDDPASENWYYLYVPANGEALRHFGFESVIQTEEELESVTVYATMTDGSTRSADMTLSSRSGINSVYVGEIVLEPGEDGAVEAACIPAAFSVDWESVIPEWDPAGVYYAALSEAGERRTERERIMSRAKEDAEYAEITSSELKENIAGALLSAGFTEAEISPIIERVVPSDLPEISIFGYAYRLSSELGPSMTAAERDALLAAAEADETLDAASKLREKERINGFYDAGQRIIQNVYYLENCFDRACEALTGFFGLPKPIQEYGSWTEVLEAIGVTYTASSGESEGSLIAKGYESVGNGAWILLREDGSFSAVTLASSGGGGSQASGRSAGSSSDGALSDAQINASVFNQNASDWGVSAASDTISWATEAGDKVIKDIYQDAARQEEFLAESIILQNDPIRKEQWTREIVDKRYYAGRQKVMNGCFKTTGNLIGAYGIYKDGMELCDLQEKLADLKGDKERVGILRNYYEMHGATGDCLKALGEESYLYDKLLTNSLYKNAHLKLNITVGTATMVGDLFSGGAATAVSTAYDTGSAMVASRRDFETVKALRELQRATANREKHCGKDTFKKGKAITPIIDPSGVVYEAVESNVLEGVKATCYDVTNGRVWDAAHYDQINPLITGKDGFYAWDVPSGTWRVDFELEGYENASTGEMPVPPPQIGLKTAMTSLSGPEIESIKAYPEYVEMIFTQYMDTATPLTVPEGYIYEWTDSTPVSEGAETEYARILRLIPESQALVGDAVSVSLSGALNYAGKPLPELSETLTVERRPDSVVFNYEDGIAVLIGENPAPRVTARVLDSEGEPIPGLEVGAVCASETYAVLTAVSAVTDENGYAVFSVEGLFPGVTEALFEVSGTGLKVELPVRVTAGTNRVLRPTAEIGDTVLGEGAPKDNYVTVPAGTELVLSCATDGAAIYYTTNDTCPCQDTAGRVMYTGPVTLTENVYLRIAAYKPGMEYSERLNIHVTVTGGAEPETEPQPKPETEEPFRYEDVKDESLWYFRSVYYCREKGYFSGVTKTRFSPNGEMTRAMFATVLHRRAGLPEAAAKAAFSDVEDGKWYTEAIAWASGAGVLNGYGKGKFGPDDAITREQIVTVLWRLSGRPETASEDLSRFTDSGEISPWAVDAFRWAVEKGLIKGRSGELLAPGDTAKRAEAAELLMKYDGLMP